MQPFSKKHLDGERKPTSFWSDSVTELENNYLARDLEYFAIMWAFKNFVTYLLYKVYTVSAHHNSLNGRFNVSEPPGQFTRWSLRLSEFHFTVKYSKGAENHHTNALYRLLTTSTNVSDDEKDFIPTFLVTDPHLLSYATAKLAKEETDEDFLEAD